MRFVFGFYPVSKGGWGESGLPPVRSVSNRTIQSRAPPVKLCAKGASISLGA